MTSLDFGSSRGYMDYTELDSWMNRTGRYLTPKESEIVVYLCNALQRYKTNYNQDLEDMPEFVHIDNDVFDNEQNAANVKAVFG